MFALPVIFWQLWAFVSPGLYSSEKNAALPFVLVVAVLPATEGDAGFDQLFVNGIDPDRFSGPGQSTIEFPAAAAGTVVVFTVFFILSVRRLRNMDVP